MRILIRGGTLIDPASDRDGRFDLLLEDSRVAAVLEREESVADAETIDAAGCWVVPGLIDIHVHLREPGYEYKETVASGSAAAVAGGFTAIACMANTSPVNDSGAVTRFIREQAEAVALARVYPIGAVSQGLEGRRLAEIGEMREAGIVAVSDDGRAIADGGLMRRALEYSRMFELPVVVHEEDPALAGEGVMNEGATSFRLGLRGMPAAAEDVMVARDIALVEHTGGRLHVAHLSTAGSVALVRQAKERGLAVTAEVTPHHLTLTDEAVQSYDTNTKMKPPLRGTSDVEAVLGGLRDGTIDAIASDHAPHHADEKDVEFEQAANGIVGLETTLALALRLVWDGKLDAKTVIRGLAAGPASCLGLPGGTLRPGTPADVTIIDPNRRWTVKPDEFRSKSRNTPFGGWELKGAALATIVGGRVVWGGEGWPAKTTQKRSAKR
jgi:dihydroorotase